MSSFLKFYNEKRLSEITCTFKIEIEDMIKNY